MPDRDDEYWQEIGRSNAYWGVLAQDRYLGGELEPEIKREFMEEGVRDMAFAVSMIERHVISDFKPSAALDFGCGVGRLVFSMAKRAAQVTGVDVSHSMLERARANAEELGVENARFSDAIPRESFDWINSYIVFQHIKPSRGIRLLDDLLSRLSPGGAISLHVSIFRDARIMHRGVTESLLGRYDGTTFVSYDAGPPLEMPIYEYDLSQVISRLVRHGVGEQTLCHTDHGGLHGVWIFGGKR